MQIWDDFLHQFSSRQEDLEVRDRYLETLHIAASCVVNKAIELREEELEMGCAHNEPRRPHLIEETN